MMRCPRADCRRWVTVAATDPPGPHACPSCEADGVVTMLEVADMLAHMAGLPAKQDDPVELAKLANQKKK